MAKRKAQKKPRKKIGKCFIKREPLIVAPMNFITSEEIEFNQQLDLASQLSETQHQPTINLTLNCISEALLTDTGAARLLEDSPLLNRVFSSGLELHEWLLTDTVMNSINSLDRYLQLRKTAVKWYKSPAQSYFEVFESDLSKESLIGDIETQIVTLEEQLFCYPHQATPRIFQNFLLKTCFQEVEEIIHPKPEIPIHEID